MDDFDASVSPMMEWIKTDAAGRVKHDASVLVLNLEAQAARDLQNDLLLALAQHRAWLDLSTVR